MAPIDSTQIARELRAQIAAGQLAPGARMPTQRELADRYGVQRAVARTAVEELVTEGLLEMRRPLGTFVRERHLEPYCPAGQTLSGRTAAYLEQLAVSGTDRSEDARVDVVPAPPQVAEHLGCPVGAAVLHRSAVEYVNHEPHRWAEVFLPLDQLGSKLPLLPRDLDEWMATNLSPGRAVDLWTVRMPSPEDRLRLRLPSAGVPVAVHTCVEFERERPVRCSATVLPADRHVIVYERPTCDD